VTGLDPEVFEAIRDLVYRRTGIAFDDRKRAFVASRVARRLAELDLEGPVEYLRHLRYADPEGSEFQTLVELLTTNETYFFREYDQLALFANHLLPELADRKREAGDRRLRLWSAACSTGDEAYTLAIILRACLDDFEDWRVEVLGTDIDRRVLSTARRATYGRRAVKDVPQPYLEAYFDRVDGGFRVRDEIRSLVRFEQLNLLDDPAMERIRGMDTTFCRNVLIYFDDAARRRVLSHFYDALHPGGYLFLGHSESVARISDAFEMQRVEGEIAYRKPLEKEEGVPAHRRRAAR